MNTYYYVFLLFFGKDKNLLNDLLKNLNSLSIHYNSGSKHILPNAFTLYSESVLSNLQCALVLTNNPLKSNKWGDKSDLNEINIEEINIRNGVLNCIGQIFIYDEFLDKTHCQKLELVLNDILSLLKNNSKKLTEENEQGLMCLSIQLVSLLNKSGISYTGPNSRFKIKLRNHPFYSHYIGLPPQSGKKPDGKKSYN